MITDVAIDLDGVVFDFSRVVTAVFSKYLKTDLPTPTKWEFFDEWNMTASDFYTLLDHLTVETEFFNSESPIRHTMVGWQSLREQNLRIHVITHRSHCAYDQTVKWLERYRLIPDTLHFAGDKAPILSALMIDEGASVDDNIGQYEDYFDMGIRSYLFNQPWNSQKKNARRVNNLIEFADDIKLYNKYWRSEIESGVYGDWLND
ncbi:hypothetical protein EBT31_20795 [bacterium]|nr:hypothetical protein [bacterium]